MAVEYIGFSQSGFDVTSFSHTLSSGLYREILIITMFQSTSNAEDPTGVTFGGNAATKIAGATTPSNDPDTRVALWKYDVPDTMPAGSKTVAVTGGKAHCKIFCIEAHMADNAIKQYGTAGSGDVTLSNCQAGSLLVGAPTRSGAYTPSFSGTGTVIASGNRYTGDTRDRWGWGVAYHIPGSGGSWASDWDTNRAHLAFEVPLKSLGGSQAIWFWFERARRFYDDLRKGMIPLGDLERRYQEVMI